MQSTFRNLFSFLSSPSSFIMYDLWDSKFRLITIALINLPLIIAGIYSLFVWPSWTVTRQIFDYLYLLKEFKMQRIFGYMNKKYYRYLFFNFN